MRARHAELHPGMECTSAIDIQNVSIIHDFITGHEMDVRALSFEDASFDIAIDKGTVTLPVFFSGLISTYSTKELWMR